MRKSYEVKIYSVSGTFLRTMNSKERISDFSFSSSINSGQSETTITLDKSFGDLTYNQGEFAKVFCYDENHQSGVVVFAGQISKIQRIYTAGIEQLELSILGFASLLSDVVLPPTTKNQSAGQTIKDIVDYFSTKYPGWLSYDTSIESGPTVNLSFTYKTCIDAIGDVAKASGYYWTISPTGKVYFFASNSTGTLHKPTLQKDIQKITVDEDAESLVNSYTLKYSSGSVTSSDSSSIATYLLHELHEEDSNIGDSTTAQNRADAYVARYKVPQKKTSMTINGSYMFGVGKSIEDIMIGELVTVRNTTFSLSALQIAKLQYNPEEIQIELTDYDSFGKLFITR